MLAERSSDGGGPSIAALAGVKVIDVATMAAAPWAAAYLGEFGADVIKVEYPGTGDHQRKWGTAKEGEALFWKSMARNKRSVTLDLHKEKGVELFKELVRTADVLVENFRPGTLERWGLGYDILSAINPRLVMLRVTGFGQTGPYRGRVGFGTLAESLSGFAHLTGLADGPPTLPNLPLADGVAGITGAFATMVALYHRDCHGGRGQVIDLSLYEPLVRLLEPALMDFDQLGVARGRVGNRSDHVAPRNTYRCSDGWVAMSGSAPSIVERLFQIIGHPELSTDRRFATNEARLENVEALDRIIGEWMAGRTREEAVGLMQQAGVALQAVLEVPEVFDDPQVKARQTLVEVEDRDFGTMRLVNVVPRLSETPGRIRSTGPHLGEHNAEVYGAMGIGAEDLGRLASEGVI